LKFGFLGYNDITIPQPGISNVDEKAMERQIKESRKKVDFLIVNMHWGAEYRAIPDERQKELSHFIIDSGADLIIGNHPHWIQPIEFYKNKLITYAHGNFIFDQMWSIETRQGVIGKYTFYENNLVDVKFTPIFIEDYGQPRPMDEKEKNVILNEMKNNSLNLR